MALGNSSDQDSRFIIARCTESVKTQQALLLQTRLNGLIASGVLIVKEKGPVLVGRYDVQARQFLVHVEQELEFEVRGAERLAELEAELNALRERLAGALDLLRLVKP